jgi:hypothetical protein
MKGDKQTYLIPQERIENAIICIRGQKVMIDTDLAALYGIPTKALKQAVKRNIDRFPSDFMFELTAEEKSEVVTHCDHLGKLKFPRSQTLRHKTWRTGVWERRY